MTTWLFEPTVGETAPGDFLEVTMRFEGDVTVCLLSGRLCAYTAPTLDAWLVQLHDHDRCTVVVDGQDLGSISSDGAGVLVDHAARFRAAGGRLLVRAPSNPARRVLELCGAGDLLEP
ncbi:MAG TPA: STAS domain-containing protein [Acidimicrobiales bacterium]|nr:STAS domain-containing protein [Acidimicrobiales bacterium]